VQERVNAVQAEVGAVKAQIAAGVVTRSGNGESGSASTNGSSGVSGSNQPSGTRDASWAKPGIPIAWQPPRAWTTDPAKGEKFRPGGEFTEIWEARTKQITPYISTDVYSRRVQEIALESLGDLDPVTLKMRGLLGEAWQVDPEGLWMRARLRSGVRFSDGTPITAEDVRWSFHEYIMNEQIDAERSRSILRDSIIEVKVLDDRTVEFIFKERLFTNVDNALSIFVMPKHFYSQFSPAQLNRSTGILLGSGPMRVRGVNATSQWQQGEPIVLERNEQYWGPKPPLEVMRFNALDEELSRLNEFRKGDADMITPSSPQFVAKSEDPEWKKDTQFLKWVNMRSGYSFIAWNCGERKGVPTPFADKRVRRAMTLLLDRERMIQDIWKGIGVVAKGNQPIQSPGSNPDITPWPFDPAAGLTLLKECGYEDRDGDSILEDSKGNPLQFEYTYASGSEIAERVARFVKDSYTAAGIKVSIRGVEWAVYTDLLKTRDFDAITLGWGANAPESDPRQIFHSESIKNQGDNFAQWANAEADRLIDAGRREMDPEKRAGIWRELEAVLHDEQPYTFIRVPPWLRFASKTLGNVNTYPIGIVPQEFYRATGTLSTEPGM
jgi:peptide/nickel transport system substrate-binding protein